MDTGYFDLKIQFWYQQFEFDDLCSFSSHAFQTKEFIASKVMYQGLAAGVLVERRLGSNPTQKPQKGD